MNFTKEYIKECDCKEIQGLRKYLEFGDFTTWSNSPEKHIDTWVYHNADKERYHLVLWLPTGDQLDDEIVKICKEKDYKYEIGYCPILEYKVTVEVSSFKGLGFGYIMVFEKFNINPLIAKIKLLKQLLKEQQ